MHTRRRGGAHRDAALPTIQTRSVDAGVVQTIPQTLYGREELKQHWYQWREGQGNVLHYYGKELLSMEKGKENQVRPN